MHGSESTYRYRKQCESEPVPQHWPNHGTAATIGDNVWIGPNVCIVEDVHIGNNSSVGAGAVVVKDVPDGATVAGVPAKVISMKPQNFHFNIYDV